MWVLSTDRAELHFFSSPSVIPGGYAILSHTWNKEPGVDLEQSHQDVRDIISKCQKAGEIPRDRVCDKIRNCCIQAEKDGYAWVWIDTCCIDKTSSAELSEAINSMFSWYAQAEVCYAYLADVPGDDNIQADEPHLDNSKFQNARWHTRGWTLQELLAPALVIFMSQDWKPLGTKKQLSKLLYRISRIYPTYLTRQKDFLLAPVIERMAWAALRETTRTEDEAYCLLGLFDISMPIVYGEGKRAFQRLQEEIIRVSYDTTLLAWGGQYDSDDDDLPQEPVEELWSGFHSVAHRSRFLIAESIRDFPPVVDLYYTPMLHGSFIQPYTPRQLKKYGVSTFPIHYSLILGSNQ